MRSSCTSFYLLKFFVFALLACQSAFVPGDDAPAKLGLAITADQVAWDQCAAYADGRELKPPTQEELSPWLGLSKPDVSPWPTWSMGVTAGEVRHFRIVFKQPVMVGTLCSPAENIALLKPDAPLPGDMANESHWQPLPRGQVSVR